MHSARIANDHLEHRTGAFVRRAGKLRGVIDRPNGDFRLDLVALGKLYRSGAVKPAEVVRLAYRRIAADANNPIWISLRPLEEALDDARRLELDHRRIDAASLPLYGVPFGIKDNIDVCGLPTTAGCRGLSCVAADDAPVVARMRAAGAIPIGKTNLDQFATGLTGTRSNLGICRNAFDGLLSQLNCRRIPRPVKD